LGHGISAFRNAVNDMRRVFDEEVTEIRTSADDPSIIDLHTRPLYLESLEILLSIRKVLQFV